MAKRFLKESEYCDYLFTSSDEDDPSGDVLEADVVHDNMYDAQSWQEDEAADLQRALDHEEENEDFLPDIATSHAIVRVPGRPRLLPGPIAVVPGPPLLSVVPLAAATATTDASAPPTAGIPAPPSGASQSPPKRPQASTVNPSVLPVVPSASTVPPSVHPPPPSVPPPPPSASPAPPPSASPVPPAASPDQNLSPVEMKSRKRRRGPLCPAEGVALKQLSDAVYRAKDNTKWHSVPNPSLPPILAVDDFETAGPTMAVFGCRTPSETFSKFLTDVLTHICPVMRLRNAKVASASFNI